jgi:uncharacterized phage protein (TIGR01671 family)
MRQIKFRGLRTDGKGWAIGDYNRFNNCHSIRFREDVDPCEVRVNPETVGQFTGLTDKNGKEIFEGDLCRTPVGKNVSVEFDGGIFGINIDYGTDRKTMLGSWGSEVNLRTLNDGYNREIEVISNIHEQ